MSTARDAFHVRLTLPVRWGDMDAYGHVNNAAYFTYCESARIRYFEEVDIDRCKEAPEHGPAVVTATCNFRVQVRYPETLEVGARCSKIGRRSFTLDYGVFRQDSGERVADGSSVVVWVDYGSGRAIPVPEVLKDAIRKLDGVE